MVSIEKVINKSPILGKGENMLELDSTIGVLKDTNIEAAKISASIVTGDVVCERLAQIVKPKLPIYARSYIDTDLGKAVLANVAAGMLITVASENKQAQYAAEAMIQSASLTFMKSFNIDQLVKDLLDGLPKKEQTVRSI